MPNPENGGTPMEYTGPHCTSILLNNLTPRELVVHNLKGKRLSNVTPLEYIIRIQLVVIDPVYPLSRKLRN